MILTSTHDDVIRYVYEETNQYENEQIEDALAEDQELLTFYLDTLETKQLMNKIVRTPSDRCVQNILDFSRNYAVVRY
jgi:peptidyl-tRNA hydrolase